MCFDAVNVKQICGCGLNSEIMKAGWPGENWPGTMLLFQAAGMVDACTTTSKVTFQLQHLFAGKWSTSKNELLFWFRKDLYLCN